MRGLLEEGAYLRKYGIQHICQLMLNTSSITNVFLEIFRTVFSKNTAGRTLPLLISSGCSVKISRISFNPLTLGGNKSSYILKQTFN